jgi:prevent-host-death family protein
MAIDSSDIISLTDARAHLSELAEEVKAGAEKIITRNGKGYVALIDAAKLDYYHRLERERGQLELLEDVERSLDDIDAGRTSDAAAYLRKLRKQRSKR